MGVVDLKIYGLQGSGRLTVLDAFGRYINNVKCMNVCFSSRCRGRWGFRYGTHQVIASRQLTGTEIDHRALSWVLNTLDEDHELEQFVSAISEYYRSTTERTMNDSTRLLKRASSILLRSSGMSAHASYCHVTPLRSHRERLLERRTLRIIRRETASMVSMRTFPLPATRIMAAHFVAAPPGPPPGGWC